MSAQKIRAYDGHLRLFHAFGLQFWTQKFEKKGL